MFRINFATAAIAMAVIGSSLVGCNGNNKVGMTSAQINSKIEREEAWRGTPKPVLTEFSHNGKLYAAGSQASADAVKAGKSFTMANKAFGFGPNGETVIFEDNKIGMADILIEQYNAKHPK